MEKISKEVQDRLDRIDWESLQRNYGISMDAVKQNPHIASQLAWGQMTDLIPGSTQDISGMFSLRAYPSGEGQDFKVKVYTMERPKTEADTLFLYKTPITSDSVKKALLEKTDWVGQDGSRKFGYANANGGRPITLEHDGRKQQYLVSIHQPTNRVVGMPVEQVKAYFMDRDGNSRGRGIYGVQFSDEQIKALSEGKAVRMDGCKTRDGENFSCYVQFDAAQRQAVTCHPTWLKEAMRTGTDLGLNRGNNQSQNREQAQQKAQEQQQQQEQQRKRSGVKR